MTAEELDAVAARLFDLDVSEQQLRKYAELDADGALDDTKPQMMGDRLVVGLATGELVAVTRAGRVEEGEF